MASHGFPSCVLNFLGIFSQNHLKTVKSFCVESLIGTSMFDQSCCCHVIGTARVGWRRGGLRWLERRACVRKNGWREVSRTSEQSGGGVPQPPSGSSVGVPLKHGALGAAATGTAMHQHAQIRTYPAEEFYPWRRPQSRSRRRTTLHGRGR